MTRGQDQKGDTHIYQDGHPITLTQTLFPVNTVERIWLGVHLGIGFAMGIGVVIGLSSMLIRIAAKIGEGM